jgi:hypothetical protein
MNKWFLQCFHQHARHGGERWFGRAYRGGQFLPFYVPRPVMPQIDEEFYPEFIEFAAARDVEVIVRYLPPKLLKAHQRIDRFKAARMPVEVASKTVFISVDHFILDGNHRWMYHRLHRSLVPCFEIKLPFNEAIALMFAFPKTYTLETHDERN